MTGSRIVHLGSSDQPTSQSEIRAALLELMRTTRNRLTRAGFFSQEAPQFSESEDALIAQMNRLDGQVTIGVLTREPVCRGGPAHLEFVILN